MPADVSGRRVSYDRFWGALLLLTCFMPLRTERPASLWRVLPGESAWVQAWLLVGSAAGLFAVAAGLSAWRGRWRHLINFAFGVATLGLPILAPVVWARFPASNPARVPVEQLGSIGWVVLVALAAIYAGSGIRIVRPSHIAGQALGALGAILLAVFAFLPLEGRESSYALARLKEMLEFKARWRELVPFLVVAASALVATLNLVRSRAEVLWAKLTRLLLVGGLLFPLVLSFVERGVSGPHVPEAWGALRFLAPLFLSVDGCIAFVAISMTRSAE